MVGTNEQDNMFEVQIPTSVQRAELDYLWLMLQSEKRRLGIDTKMKPKKEFYKNDTYIAYWMWKFRRDNPRASWSKLVNEMNSSQEINRAFDITSAKRHLRTYGYYI